MNDGEKRKYRMNVFYKNITAGYLFDTSNIYILMVIDVKI